MGKLNARWKTIFPLLVLAGVVIAGCMAAAWGPFRLGQGKSETKKVDSGNQLEAEPRVALAPGQPDTILVPESLLGSRFKTGKVQPAPPPPPLKLSGSIFLDSNRLARVHSLFSGQIVKMGMVGDLSTTTRSLSNSPEHGLRNGDPVKKGQILAVVWSKEVGEKKSELVDATSQLAADQKVLDRYKSVDPGIVSLNVLTQARRAYEADLNNVARAERTLRSWQLTEEEIAQIKAEAQKLLQSEAKRDPEVERSWAEFAIRAPFDAIVVEKNVTIGDVIDPTVDLFKIADLSRMQVLANVYEEDLPKLQQLGSYERLWQVYIESDPNAHPIPGEFTSIGKIIDPNQHTGTVVGWIDNPGQKLRVGQFVTARVTLPPDPTLVRIPATALAEDGKSSTVFVQAAGTRNAFTRRKVAVAIRGRDSIMVRREPTATEKQAGAESLHPGETILLSGVLELGAELDDLKTNSNGH